ncbi:MAG: M1 family metallopeptidase [Microcystis aeruginosa K13-05]|uniref:M1 family metallopeptidase n=1 Tax=unclassified Microcystis TaxID=2643300 RepID=UPI0022BD8409|nr:MULTISPECIES: M1 family metallopeptidase [unclassified Microcystis]MCZ8047199.1 M1 family metallopeptidase [Microcystis sp. LE19-41.2A]MCZ8289140.1 M1 family metallopeptidase [Microcystis sp. LE19-59.1C]NCR81900.1 M1 family metallopeptidase [Microcystis aeruginosa K13-10]NCR86572.1 M1 family metallopeptidase [Microcystis aeruginosa K13-05]
MGLLLARKGTTDRVNLSLPDKNQQVRANMSHLTIDTENNQRQPFELPGAKPHYNPDRPGQVNHIFLDLIIDIPQQSFQGSCQITLTPIRQGISSLTLDAVDLNINSVFIEGISQPFDYDRSLLTIHLLQPTTDKPIILTINYQVKQPQRGLYFIGPDEYYPDKPMQVWTQGEDEDSRFWFPCFDYPGQLTTSEIRVKIPQPYIAISNGELISVATVGEDRIYHWSQKQIHPTYLMTLAVGDFAELCDSWNGVPVTYYVEKGREEEGQRSMGKTPRMIEFFSQKFGYPYPYPKYAQVCVDDFIFGGMENTSTTILTDRCLIDQRASIDHTWTESLVAHELAHQWFGDLVVIKHWSHAWIKEGMASYSEVLWTESEYGKAAGSYYLLGEARSYLEEDTSRYRRPIVTHVYREAIELYDRHLYEKGACVYHMIRSILGEDLFGKAIQTFVRDNAHKTVETVDLLRAIEKATGYNLLFLFDQYVYRGGHPDYKVAYSWDNQNNLAQLTVTQTQDEKELFDLKIPVAFAYLNSEDITYNLRIHQKEQTFYFPLAQKPDFVKFDRGNNFLKTVTLEYPIGELKAQLQQDTDPISRIYAAIAIAKKGGLEAIEALGTSLENEPFWGVRVEVAKQLATLGLDQAVTALIKGLNDEKAQVRRAIVEGLSEIKTLDSYNALKSLLETGDASYYVEAAAARGLGSMAVGQLQNKEGEIIDLLNHILQSRKGWNEVVRAGAIGGLSQLKTSPAALESILTYTALGTPQPLRLGAIRALGAISSGQSTDKLTVILERLETIAKETFFLTQVAVCNALGQIENAKAIVILQALSDRTPDGRVRRVAEEAVQKVQKKLGSDKAIQEIREELEKMKQENQELKSRLTKLEAKNS